MKITLKVLRKDINAGKKGDGEQCAIAQAVKRQLGGKNVYANGLRISYTRGNQRYTARTSGKATDFIYDFDTKPKSKIKPTTLQLKFAKVPKNDIPFNPFGF